jgi:hypothetical protein
LVSSLLYPVDNVEKLYFLYTVRLLRLFKVRISLWEQ